MLFEVNGVKVISPYSKAWGKYRMDISYKTALLYEDGENVCSFYCSSDKDGAEIWRALHEETLVKDYDVPSEIAKEMAEYIEERIVRA